MGAGLISKEADYQTASARALRAATSREQRVNTHVEDIRMGVKLAIRELIEEGAIELRVKRK